MTGTTPSGAPPSAAFVFPGDGAQYPAMTARLVLESQRYGAHLQAASAALQPHTGIELLDLIVAGDDRIDEPGLAEPALFAVQYALARTLQEFGLAPCAVLGHGLGEFAAAVSAGALPLGRAAPLVAGYGTATDERFAELADRTPTAVPRTPYYSSARGRRLSGEVLDGDYWVELRTGPERFEPALADLLLLEEPGTVVEIGPRPVLSGLVEAMGDGRAVCLPVCRSLDAPASALYEVLERVGLGRRADDPITRIVLDAVAEVLAEPGAPIGLDAALRNDLGFDSVMLMRLKFRLEQQIPEVGRIALRDMLEYLVTPGVVADFLRLQLAAAPAVP
ncbi:acyltransferase domain-containing protein [Catenulispora subtropica]|uniref:Carrier domain-containing protein n=1 Tax=Catenulispora subtropica TaxID=450798 RepID=A0ABP5EGY4_9ACTN